MVSFGDVEPFLANAEVSAATTTKFLKFFTDPPKQFLQQVELAAIVDAGKPFVQATYKLKGDGPLVFSCYEMIATLTTAVNMAHCANVREIAGNSTAAQQCMSLHASSQP